MRPLSEPDPMAPGAEERLDGLTGLFTQKRAYLSVLFLGLLLAPL